ncbi:MAG: excinuclease ABC subunit UvrA [Planctomycetota bacterium]|nr:excinuclease ABC subunit UvrA [Planctomycetota bacterium]
MLRDVLTPRRQSPSRSSKQKLGGKRKKTGRRTDDAIQVVGAREHNLKDITVRIPRGAMTVCSGVSGSGKSSLAIDTVYTEGQRRYVESLSAYARQFLGQLQKPKVDHVYGLSPAVAIEQKAATKSPRSTVGTVTEIYDYMRVLWARVGQPYCPRCDIPIGTQSSEEIADSVASMPDGTKLLLCAPIERGPGESWDALFARCRANGYTRIRIDANVCELSQELSIDARRRHDVELVVDRVAVRSAAVRRIGDSVEQCLAVGDGVMVAVDSDSGAAKRFSQHFSCDSCQTSYDELTPHHFSFNARMGWCKHCEGLGVQRGTGVESVVIQPHLSILGGAIAGWENVEKQPMLRAMLEALANAIGFKPKAPLNTLTDAQRHVLLFGLGDRWVEAKGKAAIGLRFQWKGFFPTIDEATKMSWRYRTKLEHLVTDVPCTRCSGGRIRPEATAVRVGDRSIVQVCAMLLRDSAAFFRELRLDKRRTRVAGELLHEIKSRLQFLVDVGLDYLSLDRQAPTLSGGESQRIRLASQIGSGLTGVLYVLDEPTIGLHPRDNKRLIAALHKLRDLGNTLLLVEHDREVIEASDHVIDFGPGAGAHGGHVVGAGSPRGIRRQRRSLTGRYLAGKASIGVPTNRRPVQWPNGADDDASPPALTVMGARHNNLDSIDVSFPIGRFNCITGVSGSGKSSLVSEVLYPALAARIHRARLTPGAHEEIRGADHIDKVISVDQQPIGNSPSSNAATYTGVFDVIRELFAKLSDSKIRGYTANRFSFNRAGGRCDDCNGLGQVCHEMHFLPDVWVPCESCGGSRYNRETLQVRYKSKSIADVLAMPASAAVEHFANVPKVRRMLKTIEDVGLGYLQLGQAAPTLSGGEAQRVKLAAELGRPNTGKTLYILDEPTTGLHFEDLRKLLDVLHRLVDLGNTVLCIEHNLDVIKTADWIVDLGPEAGRDGGRIVAAGAPEDVAKVPESHTGRLLAAVLKTGPRVQRERFDAKAAAAKAAREEKLAAPEIESGVRMPWERNGRKWHTGDRVSRDGQKIEWEGRALAFVVDLIEKQGGTKLLPTVWNDRARVEINARAPDGLSQSSAPWFFHARTGARWLLDFSFRVPRSTFTGPALKKRLKLKTLDEREDIPAYGSEPRVRVRRAGEMDDVRVQVYDKKEVSSSAFRTFVSTALKSHVQHLSRLAGDTAMATPWKVDGRAWHLSQKSIRGRESKEWKPIVLMELIGKLNRIAPTMKADWSRKITVSLQNANGASIGMIVTNNRYGLRVILRTPAGRFTPTMIEHLGLYPEVKTAKGTGQVSFWVQTLDQVHGPTLKAVVTAAVEPK